MASTLPPIGNPFLLSSSTDPIIAAIAKRLMEADQKPRSPSEWHQRFLHWRRPSSMTEATQMAAAERRVRRALERDAGLNASCAIQPQGSYHNNTNVRTESDIDLCVRHTTRFRFESPPGEQVQLHEVGWVPLRDGIYDEFREDIARVLRAEYGAGAVTMKPERKSIQLHKDHETKVPIDIVPAHTFIQFGARTMSGRLVQYEGVAICVQGLWIISFPQQHLENGVAKNVRTKRRYKRVVRILKNMSNHCARNTSVLSIRPYLAEAPSFLIESLVYNVPDEVFLHNDGLYDTVVNVLSYLRFAGTPNGFRGTTPMRAFTEVNEIQPLFGHRPPPIEKAIEFVAGARHYMDLE